MLSIRRSAMSILLCTSLAVLTQAASGASTGTSTGRDQEGIFKLFTEAGTTTEDVVEFLRLSHLDFPFIANMSRYSQGGEHNNYLERLAAEIGVPKRIPSQTKPFNKAQPWIMPSVPFTKNPEIMKAIANLYRTGGTYVLAALLKQISITGVEVIKQNEPSRNILLNVFYNHPKLVVYNRAGGSFAVAIEFLKEFPDLFSTLHLNYILHGIWMETQQVPDLANSALRLLQDLPQESLTPMNLRFVRVMQDLTFFAFNDETIWPTSAREWKNLHPQAKAHLIDIANLNSIFFGPFTSDDKEFILSVLFLHQRFMVNGSGNAYLSNFAEFILGFVSIHRVNTDSKFVYELAQRLIYAGAKRESGLEYAMYKRLMLNLTQSNVNVVTYAEFYGLFRNSFWQRGDQANKMTARLARDDEFYKAVDEKMKLLLRDASPEEKATVKQILGDHMPSDMSCYLVLQ